MPVPVQPKTLLILLGYQVARDLLLSHTPQADEPLTSEQRAEFERMKARVAFAHADVMGVTFEDPRQR